MIFMTLIYSSYVPGNLRALANFQKVTVLKVDDMKQTVESFRFIAISKEYFYQITSCRRLSAVKNGQDTFV